ncbi:MAG: transposase [Syntrophobacteraceae bacterium]
MVYVRQLAEVEHRELKEMSRKEIGRVSRRAQMVLMSSKSLAVPDIAVLLDVCPATVRFWIRKFEAEGPGGLYDGSRSGRPRNEEGLNAIRESRSCRLEESLRNIINNRKRT